MERGTEQESLEVCANEGLGVLPWSPLKGYVMLQYELKAVADPGFLRAGNANPRGGAPTYYFAIFQLKMKEIATGVRDAHP